MATENATRRRSQRQSITIIETSGTIGLPAEAFGKIESHLPERIRTPDLQHVTTTCRHRLRMKTDLQTFVEHRGEAVILRSRDMVCIIGLLKQAGYEVTWKREPLSPTLTTPRTDVNYRFFSAKHLMWLTYHRFGQFIVGSTDESVQLVADFVLAFPTAPFLLPFCSQEQAQNYRDALRMYIREPIEIKSGLRSIPSSRITICTSWAAKSFALMDCPAVIFPLWPGSLHEWIKLCSLNPGRERMYLVRTRTDHVSKIDEEELTHRIGPVILDFGAPRPKVLHSLHVVRFGGAAVKTNKHTDKDSMYWKHGARNLLLANLGQEICRKVIFEPSMDGNRCSVAILVESTEHASRLHGLLNDFPMITTHAKSGQLPANIIITLSKAAELKEFRPDWIIIGSGGPPSPWFGSWIDNCTRNGHTVHVVDLSDGFDVNAAKLSEARQEDIRNRGVKWRPLSKDIVKKALCGLRDSCRPSRSEVARRVEVY